MILVMNLQCITKRSNKQKFQNLYEVYYFNNTNSNRKIRFQIFHSRPFAAQPFELAAGWGSESGLGALARLIQQITDSMA